MRSITIPDLVAGDGPQPAAKAIVRTVPAKGIQPLHHGSKYVLREIGRIGRLNPLLSAPVVNQRAEQAHTRVTTPQERTPSAPGFLSWRSRACKAWIRCPSKKRPYRDRRVQRLASSKLDRCDSVFTQRDRKKETRRGQEGHISRHRLLPRKRAKANTAPGCETAQCVPVCSSGGGAPSAIAAPIRFQLFSCRRWT